MLDDDEYYIIFASQGPSHLVSINELEDNCIRRFYYCKILKCKSVKPTALHQLTSAYMVIRVVIKYFYGSTVHLYLKMLRLQTKKANIRFKKGIELVLHEL